VPFLNGSRLEVARDPTPDATGEDEHGRSTPPSPAVLAMESSSIRHGGLVVFVDPTRGLLSRLAAVEASSSIRRGALQSREVEPEVLMRRRRPSPEDNNNPPEGALPGCLRRSCTASPPSSTSPPLIQARGLLSAVAGSIRDLRSAAAADEEIKAGSRAWPELEAREETEAAREEEEVAAGGGSRQRRREEGVARWLLGCGSDARNLLLSPFLRWRFCRWGCPLLLETV
jgi:hypothetical protein